MIIKKIHLSCPIQLFNCGHVFYEEAYTFFISKDLQLLRIQSKKNLNQIVYTHLSNVQEMLVEEEAPKTTKEEVTVSKPTKGKDAK